VWKVELLPAPANILLEDFRMRCRKYFDTDGCVIDQPFQPRLPEGMIRCYMGADRVVGFGCQLIRVLIPPPDDGPASPEAQPGPRIMHPASTPQFQRLRMMMESDWLPHMLEVLDIERESLPLIWDADFLYGPRTEAGENTYVLCEINVSSVFPIPDQAPEQIARLAANRRRSSRSW
jgi:hypothetical protein